MTEEQKKVMTELEDQMNTSGYRTRVEEEDGYAMLRILMDDMGTAKNGEVLMELCFLPVASQELPEDFSLFQIFTTIAGDIRKERMADVLAALNKTNLDCLLGGFHIFEEERQLYHRYVGVVRGKEKDAMLASIEPAVNWVAHAVDEVYDELTALCRG